jgi:hypothetical protein
MEYLTNNWVILPHSCCNDILFLNLDYLYKNDTDQVSRFRVVRYERMVVKNRVHATGN